MPPKPLRRARFCLAVPLLAAHVTGLLAPKVWPTSQAQSLTFLRRATAWAKIRNSGEQEQSREMLYMEKLAHPLHFRSAVHFRQHQGWGQDLCPEDDRQVQVGQAAGHGVDPDALFCAAQVQLRKHPSDGLPCVFLQGQK